MHRIAKGGVMSTLRVAWMAVASSLFLLLAFPVEAHHCKGAHASDPECDGGGGGGSTTEVLYQVDVADDSALDNDATLYNPSCDAFTREQKGPGVSYTAYFDRHDLCATVTTSPSGETLTDDIVIRVGTNEAGEIVSVQLTGQDVIGKEGVFHESEVVQIDPPVVPSADGFTIPVNADNLPIWKCDRHTSCHNRFEIIGEIAIDQMIYSPAP